MQRTLLIPSLALLALAFSGHAVASAQTITVTLETIGGEDSADGLAVREINAADCDGSGTTLGFKLKGVPSSKELIAVWEGSNCIADAERKDEGNCDLITTQSINEDSELSLDIETDALDCVAGKSAKWQLWFLGVDAEGESGSLTTGYGTINVEYDTDPPAAPTNVEGGAGENKISVGWDSDESDIEEYIVFWDSSGSSPDGSDAGADNGECASATLTPGEVLDLDALPDGVSADGTNSASTGTSLAASKLGDAEVAAIAVAAVDKAGNLSPLSDIGCVKVVPTVGFYDYYKQQGGNAETGCSVSSVGKHSRNGLAGLALLGVLGMAVQWYRRRSS